MELKLIPTVVIHRDWTSVIRSNRILPQDVLIKDKKVYASLKEYMTLVGDSKYFYDALESKTLIPVEFYCYARSSDDDSILSAQINDFERSHIIATITNIEINTLKSANQVGVNITSEMLMQDAVTDTYISFADWICGIREMKLSPKETNSILENIYPIVTGIVLSEDRVHVIIECTINVKEIEPFKHSDQLWEFVHLDSINREVLSDLDRAVLSGVTRIGGN